MDRPRTDIVVKNVKGRLLRREESYTETSFPESADDQTEDDVALYLNPHHKSEVYTFDPAALSPKFSSNVSPALQRNVRAWCEATGLPTTITIHFMDRIFHVHKFPLVSRSGYFKKALKEAKDVTMASDEVPGGVDIFELALNFCYGSTILMEPTNIAEISCVADYLQMSEDYGRANLCERSELYLNQVALQSWDDTLVVLLHCENLNPYAEQLGIVRQCLDAMAFMACVEVLGPVARKAMPGKTGELQCWEMRESSCLPWWIQDLVALPPGLFVKMVLALRREGMQENSVGQVVTAFADRWIFGDAGVDHTVLVQKGSDKCWVMEPQTTPELSVLVESVVRVLPLERNVVPIGFLFGLLRRGLTCASLHEDCRIQLETRIALQFEHATLLDLLLPSNKEKDGSCVFRNELDSMERILKLFLTRFRGYDETRVGDMSMLSEVGKVWDEYLTEIAFDSSITPARFAELIERIPAYMRVVHDHVYRAIHTYLKAHPSSNQEDRVTVCRTLNCQKLSQEACAHAVQNELMPLRLVVQAMFMQQLQTRSVLTSRIESASQSFREPPKPTLSAHHSRSILPEASTFYYPAPGASSRRHVCDYSQDSFRSVGSSFRDNDLYIDDLMYAASQNIVKKEMSVPTVPIMPIAPVTPAKMDYEVTESRLRSLEAELSKMRVALAHSMSQQASTSAHQPKVVTKGGDDELVRKTSLHSSRSGGHRMVPVEDMGMSTMNCTPTGCLAHLQPVNRTSGLLAKTLQKLTRFSGFGKSKAAVKHVREPVISAPIVESVERGPLRGFPVQAQNCSHELASRFDYPEMGRFVGRNDSMPRPVSSRVQKPSHHVRHRSFS
ncbi:hypothetical protein KC19_3G064600 [Ceratodon purpureus]|uniref:BTB/POZ domain-containing protein n=1 Tax=Ceratodon purpureus TaxID=3225 RepID=A0A8T0II59_CERPU|nr:hypothetical protein KC19_3G064600 [Ceratodon purpureus]